MRSEIVLQYEYRNGPIWTPDEPDYHIDEIVTNDEELMDLNLITQILFTSYYNFTDDISPYYVFNDDYFNMDKNIHDDLRKKMLKRLHELDDGTFKIFDDMKYEIDELKPPVKNGFINGKRRVILRLDYHIPPINTLDDLGRRTLQNLPIIENDQIVMDLSHQLQNLFEQCFEVYPKEMGYLFNKELYHTSILKIDSLMKRIRERLNEINDGSFIVDPEIIRNYIPVL